MRRAALAELLRQAPASEAAAALGELVDRSGSGDPDVTVALDSAGAALSSDEIVDYELRAELYAAATDRGDDVVARLLLQHGPQAQDRELDDALAPGRPAVPRGRVLTLGERKSLARGGRRELVTHLLRDPHPDVVAELVINPRLTESDALVLAARRPAVPESLAAVYGCDRWRARYRIRRALAFNPYTPLPLALRVALTLRDADLDALARDGTATTALRTHAREILARRRA